MTHDSPLPRLSRIRFFRLQENELICALAGAIQSQGVDADAISDRHAAVLAWAQLSGDVPNGGFEQFFFNHRGDHGVEVLAELLDSIDVPKAGDLLRSATLIYHKNAAAFQTDQPWEGLFGSIREFEKLETDFMNVLLRGNRALEKWVRSHIAELAVDENGDGIDPLFTGTIELPQANGLVGEYLEVKKGKPHGAYRTFFEDGTVRKVTFYKSGKVTGDFWPDGVLKRKESKRGPHTIIEWYYPSGALQKRYVKDKDGYTAEPVRRFHENGQLAEETSRDGLEKVGPWLKFFADGSPQLQAEYDDEEKLIVHNAWSDDGVQVVRDGTGVFHDDGIGIDWEYDVFFKHQWQWDKELCNGVQHGKTTMFNKGVLWRVDHFENGVRSGESTSYWDNGRVRAKATYVAGKEVKKESFPKFDRPVPAVVVVIQANEELYTAWEHLRVDRYPQVLNFDEIQAALPMPNFLREVYERNQSRTLKSDYEDWNTFDDGIAYFLTVNEAGEVTSAVANGSGACSGGSWGVYPPYLERLRFTPGYVGERAVECRVLARVKHTFVEGS